MAKLIALSTIEHDGKVYAEGDEFNVADKAQVAALEAAGVAVVAGKKAAAAAEPEQPTE